MSKITLTDLANLQNETTAVNAINNNNAILETAFDKTLSRDGTAPNQMGAPLDMNSNRIINVPDAIAQDEPVNLGQMVDALVAAGNINIGGTVVPVSAVMQPVVGAATITVAQGLLGIPAVIPDPYVDCTDPVFAGGVQANGVTDDTAALQAAVNFAAGREVRMPPGTLVITSQIRYETNSLFAPGLYLTGSGAGITFIDNRVASNSCIYTGGGVLTFQRGGKISDFSMKTTTSPVASHGIEHFSCYQYIVENISVTGLSGDAMRVTSNLGDADASNIMLYRNCRIDSCDKGVNCNFAFAIIQPSFMSLENLFINHCNIGFRWMGLSGYMCKGGFTECGIGLQIPNNGATNAQYTSVQVGFENNTQAIQIGALAGGTFIETELAGSNIFFPSTKAVEILAGSAIRFSDSRIRIASTPHVLWTLGPGVNTTIIENSFYQSYDLGGQSRYAIDVASFGNRIDDSFDNIIVGSHNGISSIACVNGLNSNLAAPIEGACYAIGAGVSGVYSIGGLTNGYNGRRLTLINTSGQILTLIHESASSTTTNRLRLDNNADIAINPNGACVLIYTVLDNRWHMVGHG